MLPLVLCLLSEVLAGAPAPTFSDAYVNGKGGYPCYRQPVLAVGNGIILAFASARSNTVCSGGDVFPFYQVVRRSTDGGLNWSDVITLYKGSPDYYVVVWDEETEKFTLIVQTGENLVWTSTDGLRWEGPTTMQVNGASGYKQVYPSVGKAITVSCSKCNCRAQDRKRILLPFVCNNGTVHSCIVYSDDHLKTFNLGAVGANGSRESQIAQLVNEAGVCEYSINSRNMGPTPGHRFVQRSSYGENLTSYSIDMNLPEPITPNWTGIVASLLRFSWPTQSRSVPSRLLYSSPQRPDARADLAIYHSQDEGRSWNAPKLLKAGPAAYSDLAVDENGVDALVLFENGPQTFADKITLGRFNMEWLEE